VSSLSLSLLAVGGGVLGVVAATTAGGAGVARVAGCGAGMAATAKALVISALTRSRMSVWTANAPFAVGASALSGRSE
jgi:hypothetical protein